MFYINQILDAHSLNTICETLNQPDLFENGIKTAGRTARQVKNNLQGRKDAPEIKAAAKMIENALWSHSLFKAAAIPKQFAKIMFNHYGEGMAYGAHVDEAFIENTRTDLSFTLFLSEPDEYEGGELVIDLSDGSEVIKLPKGTMVLYPSTSLHHITPVKSGQRLAAVGWIQSRIRLAEQRNVLFDLYQAQMQLPDTPENKAARLSLLKAKSNLIRLWAD